MSDWLILVGCSAALAVAILMAWGIGKRRKTRLRKSHERAFGAWRPAAMPRSPEERRLRLCPEAVLVQPIDAPPLSEERIEELRLAVTKAFTGPPHSEIVLLEEGLKLEVEASEL